MNYSSISLRIFCMAGLLALWLAACAPAPAAPAGALTIAVPRGVTADAASAYAAWFEQQSGARIVIEPIGVDRYEDQVTAALLSGSNRYDLVYLPAASLGKWAAYHALLALSAPPDPRALEPWLDLTTLDGQVYGMPIQPDPEVLWYRADLLQSANLQPPADWESFRAAARALNQPPARYGAVIAGSDIDAADTFSAVLAGFGGQAIDDHNKLTINAPPAAQALALYAGLRGADKVTAPEAEKFTAIEVLAALQGGKAALGLAPLSAGAALRDCKESPKVCDPTGKPWMAFTWVPGLPRNAAVGGLGVWAVPIHAAHAQSAQAFAAGLATPQGANAWASGGGIPADRTALGDPALQAQVPGADRLAAVEHYQLTIPPLSTGEAILKAYHQAVHNAVAGTQAPGLALDAAALEIKKALRQGGY